MEWAGVVLGCLVVGTCLGLSGYGGFLVPPLLVWALDLDPRTAVAHALLASLLPALLGAALYRRGHGLDARLVLLLCAGTVPGVLLGGALSRASPAWLLQAAIGAAVLVAGLALVRPRRHVPVQDLPEQDQPEQDVDARTTRNTSHARTRPGTRTAGTPATLTAGVLSGTAGVVVGVGGPLVTTPVLVAGGVALAPAVGAGLANNALVAGIGSLSLLSDVTLDPAVLAVVAGTQLVGVLAGVRLRPRVPAAAMSRLVAAVAVLTGLALLVAALT